MSDKFDELEHEERRIRMECVKVAQYINVKDNESGYFRTPHIVEVITNAKLLEKYVLDGK